MYQQLRHFLKLPLMLTFISTPLYATTSFAETLLIPVGSQSSTMTLPKRGEQKKQVLQEYGQPQKKNAAVGKPPISTWRYANFSVYFEGNAVIHAVAHHKPKK